MAWLTPAAIAQETTPPQATVSIGAQTVAAEGYGGGCTFYFSEDRMTASGVCPVSIWPPTRFADLMATGGPAIVRFDRPIAVHPNWALSSRDPMRSSAIELAAAQRDELTWEVALPSVTAPRFLTFGGSWSSARARGDAGYVVGVLPVPQDSALEIRRVKWTGAQLRASGKVHPYAGSVILRFACNGTAIVKTVPAGAGQWSIAFRTPSACAATSEGRLVVRVSSTDRLRAGKVVLRLAHRIPRR